MENIWRLVLYVMAGYALLTAFIVLSQRSFIYLPNKTKPDSTNFPQVREIHVTTQDGLTLHGWWSPPENDEKDDASPVILYFHGNAGNIANRIPRADFYRENGIGVLLAEYRGYGGNQGKPSEYGFYRDARAYMEWLSDEQNIAPSRIVFYGESLGTGVAIQMAKDYQDAKAVILETPFLSVLSMAQYRMPFIPLMEFFLKDHFRSDLKINDFDTPVLIGVAGQDFVVPSKFAEELYTLRQKEKRIIRYPDAGHNDLYDYGFGNDVLNFINQN